MRGRPPDPAADLTPEERARYDALRQWRNDAAKRTGKPPYLFLNNKQAAALARRPPATKAALREVAGIGDARVAEIGDELLKVLAALTEAGTVAGSSSHGSAGSARSGAPASAPPASGAPRPAGSAAPAPGGPPAQGVLRPPTSEA